jgi:hypothetical protein
LVREVRHLTAALEKERAAHQRTLTAAAEITKEFDRLVARVQRLRARTPVGRDDANRR